ncbi:hypothetical protein V6N13_098648 [Hibiscus sabdariffa]|uniref:Dihydroxy-acid/6-phosphogluconate dehydratase N-terminal domain-containing protein n=1 Tax=Hibiscus sabdariffa TaxID=183260 RepID=A0ABR2EEI1_9ROSI
MQATLLFSQATLVPTRKLSFTVPTNHSRCLLITAQSQAILTADSPSPQTIKLNKYSSRTMEPKSQGTSQTMPHGVGLPGDDLLKPQVGYEGNTCNMHLLKLSEEVKRGVEESGMLGFKFQAVGVSDRMSIGMGGVGKGLKPSDLIADSSERANMYDFAGFPLPQL